jgi:hypothetical protein
VADGGDLRFSDGVLESHGAETIYVSIVIPPGKMPPNGWPVSLFAHPTGGDFTTHITVGATARLAATNVGEDDPVRVPSVSIDAPLHGPRRGVSHLPSELLFGNLENPLALVGNLQQAAADYFLLIRMLEELTIDFNGLDEAIHFDPENFYFFGHSQGATIGATIVPFERRIHPAIFAGAGGSLVLSLLNRTSPDDVTPGVRFVLTKWSTNSAFISDTDPLLAVMQMVADPVDPLSYARLIYRSTPSDESDGTHVLQPFGYDDTFTPEPTQIAYSQAAGLQVPIPHIGEMTGYGGSPPTR